MRFAYFPLLLKIITVFYTMMLGGVFASFFTCVAERVAANKDWIKARSVCDSCGHPLKFGDLIPIFSYIFHKGRCNYCNAKIPKNCLYGELGLGLYFTLIFIKYGFSIETVRFWGLGGILLGLSIVDLKKYEIPDGFILAGIGLWVITLPFYGSAWFEMLKSGLLGALGVSLFMLISALVMDKLLGKESLGGGDIKLFFMIGLYLGLPNSIFNLILSCIIGLVFVFILKKDKIPFGPAIALATVISSLLADYVTAWYLGLF